MLFLTVIVFVVMLLLLVLVHEAGHLLAAKRAGCTVEEFGFGFPPRLFSRTWGGTRYSFNLLPLGGFVKIEGEDMDDKKPGPTSFASKSAGWRITILAAGVVMNVVLTAVLLSVQGVIGIPTAVTDDNAAQLSSQQTYIVEVAEGSPAQAAGLLALDRIAAIDGLTQPTTGQVQEVVSQRLGEELDLLIDRQGVRHELVVMARENPPENEGAIGVRLSGIGLITVPWWQAPWHGVVRTAQMLAAILGQFADLLRQVVTGSVGGVQFLGPVGIASYTNEVTQMGFGFVLEFAALISLNLAIINILPIPALDGGRILFVLIEQVRGKRLPAKTEHLAHTVGFMLLLVLILVITWQDILRFV